MRIGNTMRQKKYKFHEYSLSSMFGEHVASAYATIVLSILVIIFFATSLVQHQAIAQGTLTIPGGNMSNGNRTGSNMTAGGTMSNPAGTNMTKILQ